MQGAGVCMVAVVASVGIVRADDMCVRATNEALAICQQDDPATEKVARLAALDRGVATAERAIAADPTQARAHFALFCNLGKQLEIAGVSWRSLQRLDRLKETIDRALALAPDDADILVAKGELLRRLPRMLGGDSGEAARLFRLALAAQPDHVAGRLFLAELLVESDNGEAEAAVARALDAVERRGTFEDRAAARALVAQLHD